MLDSGAIPNALQIRTIMFPDNHVSTHVSKEAIGHSDY
mgnify:CR=1 FL=1